MNQFSFQDKTILLEFLFFLSFSRECHAYLKVMDSIDFEECLKDSPVYRTQLRQATNHIDLLEDRVEQIFKSCQSMINNGKIFLQDFQ